MSTRADDDGFTLVELMVVVLVMGILLAVAVPQFLGARARAQDGTAKSNLRTVFSAAANYAATNAGSFPDSAQLSSEVTGYTFVGSTSASTPRTISVSAALDRIRLAARSNSGSCVRMMATAGEEPVWSTASSGSCQASYGVVTTVAGSGTDAVVDGTGTGAGFSGPVGGVFDSQGNLFVADGLGLVIRKITPAGVVTTFAGSTYGSTNGTGTAAKFGGATHMAVDAADNLYVADAVNNRIRKITPAGVVTTFAGSTAGYLNGTGTGERFNAPMGLASDPEGNLYVADTNNNRIRVITPAGVVTTLAGSGATGYADGSGASAIFNHPYAIAYAPSGDLYVADSDGHRIRKVTRSGVVTTLAGSGSEGNADGSGAAASFRYPYGIAVDRAGVVWVADTYNDAVRQVTGDGVVTTYAGGTYDDDDGVGPLASFASPWGVAAAADGTVYVFDTNNHRIRKIS